MSRTANRVTGPPAGVLACYRLMTSLATERHRVRFSDEQEELFSALWLTERPSGTVGGALWTCEALLRAGMAAIGTRLDARRRQRLRHQPRFNFRGSGGPMWSDVRFTWRALRRSPWYSLTAVGVIAVTLALATTVFAVVDGVLFRPLPYPDLDRLVIVEPGFEGLGPATVSSGARVINSVSDVDIDNWRAAVPGLLLTGYRAQPWSGMGDGVNRDAAGVASVQANFFDVIGVAPAVGGFVPEDFASGQLLMPVILSFESWRSRFGGRADAVGTEVILDRTRGTGYRIVGIMPEGFVFPANTMFVEFITPLTRPAEAQHDASMRGIAPPLAKLPEGMPAAQLQERLQAGVDATAAQFPPRGPKPEGWSDTGWRRQGPYEKVDITRLTDVVGRDARPVFRAVFLAVAVLVGLASMNLSSLMSARVVERRRELDVRRAIGAPGSAIARLMVTEAGLIIAAGTTLGLAASQPLLQLAVSLLPDNIVLLKPAAIDWRVAGFVGLTVVTLTLVTAIAPIVRSGSQSSRSVVVGGSSERTRTVGRFAVVAAQVAGACVLTVVGALLVGSVLAVYANDQPIRTDGIVVVDIMFQGEGATMDVSEARTARARTLVERVQTLPGVLSVGATASQVLRGGGEMSWFVRPSGARSINVDTQAVTPDFYRTLEPRLVSGRLPAADELVGNAPVVVIGERVVDAFWPDAHSSSHAIGRELVDQKTQRVFTVVGVVEDVRWTSWDAETASIYGPYALLSRAPWMTLFVRTNGNTGRVLSEVMRSIGETDAAVRTTRAATLDEQFRDSIRMRRFQSWLFGAFAVVGLGVVGVGVLGLLAMTTARRTREIGIRCALGATQSTVLWWLWLEEQMSVGVGLVVGVGISLWAVTLVKAYLYGITAGDLRVWAVALLLIMLTAGGGALIPAWRASRTDPLEALRAE